MYINDYYFSAQERSCIRQAISDGAHTVGFYDADGVFFYVYQDCRPDEHYSYAAARGFSQAVARFTGLIETFLF